MLFFWLSVKAINNVLLNFLEKPYVHEKFGFWVSPKTSRPIKMQDSLIAHNQVGVYEGLWVQFLYVMRYPWKQQIWSVILTGCSQTCIPNSELASALSQEWVIKLVFLRLEIIIYSTICVGRVRYA